MSLERDTKLPTTSDDMTKRNLVWMTAALALALMISAPPATAGKKKDTGYAVSVAQKGLWREAAHRFRALLEKHPDDARLWNNLAVAYEASGEFKLAHEAYEKSVELEPEKLDEMIMNREAFESFYVQYKIRRDILDDDPIPDESDSASPDGIEEIPGEEPAPPSLRDPDQPPPSGSEAPPGGPQELRDPEQAAPAENGTPPESPPASPGPDQAEPTGSETPPDPEKPPPTGSETPPDSPPAPSDPDQTEPGGSETQPSEPPAPHDPEQPPPAGRSVSPTGGDLPVAHDAGVNGGDGK
jgi:hypothetical protein